MTARSLSWGVTTSTGTWALARFNANGSLDTSFGNGGEVVNADQRPSDWRALRTSPSMRTAGSWYSATTAELWIVLARFNADGSLDTSFGSGGLVATTFGSYSSRIRGSRLPQRRYGQRRRHRDRGQKLQRHQATTSWWPATSDRPRGLTSRSPAPTSLTAGTAGTYTISVLNPDGSADTGYSGTVQITSSDPQAVLPANFTITGGTATFSATLKTAGVQSLTATDTVTSGITGSDAGITVTPAAATQFILSARRASGAGGSSA